MISHKKEGVLLLNRSLTVREGNSNSHKKIWNGFMEEVVEFINEYNKINVSSNYIRRKNHFIQCISLVVFYFAAKVNIKHDNLAPNEVFKCTKHNVHIDNIIVWANKS